MYCKNCGEQMNDNQAICIKCGVKVGDGTAFCANCGNALPENADVCLNCGVATASANDAYLNGRDRIVIILLCIFLGTLGIHNFVLGETKKGIVKLVLTITACLSIVSVVFWIMDLVKICTDKYVVDPEKLF